MAALDWDTDWDAPRIAKAFGTMISDGEVQAGDKLAPIRTVAKELQVSTATVTDAWSILREHGLISTDRRRGTTVREHPGHGRSRYWRVPMEPGTLRLDLSTGTPDPELLPKLEPILGMIHSKFDVTSYLEPSILSELEVELTKRWPFDPQALMVVDGANDGLDRVINAVVRLGDVVLVEDPTYPLLLDQLELIGAEIIGVPMDVDGPDIEALAAAMKRSPRAFFLQTGAHNPTGICLSAERAAAIADLAAETDMLIVEDHHPGMVGPRSNVTVGHVIPDQVVRIHSFSKTHGPDLRIAAMSGPAALIDDIEHRRQLGPGWTSRLLQRVLLEMLQEPSVDDQITEATAVYQQRRDALVEALANHGITVEPGSGFNIWVPVANEQLATIALAAQGVGVAPGEPFRVTGSSPHIRVTAAKVGDEVGWVAEQLAKAAKSPSAGR